MTPDDDGQIAKPPQNPDHQHSPADAKRAGVTIPRWILALVATVLTGILVTAGIILGTSSDRDAASSASSPTVTPTPYLSPSQIGGCVSGAWAILQSSEYAAGFDPTVGGSPVFYGVDLAYSGDNSSYSAYKEVTFYAALHSDTFSQTLSNAVNTLEGPAWNEVNTLIKDHCKTWRPKTDEDVRRELDESGRGDMDVFSSPQAACAAYCPQLIVPLRTRCYLSQPWTCKAWASEQMNRITDLELALSTLRAPDNRYAYLTIHAATFFWQSLSMDNNQCYETYSQLTYPSACQDSFELLQAAQYQYTHLAAGLPGYPRPTTSRTPTTSDDQPPTSSTPAVIVSSTTPDLFSTETTEPIQLFQTPTGNIKCGMNSGFTECRITEHAFLVDQCDRVFTDDNRITNQTVGPPVDTQLLSATLKSSGTPDISGCMGNTLQFSDFTTVPYGTVVQSNGTSCTVAETGVRCLNPEGHGFNLARAAFDTF